MKPTHPTLTGALLASTAFLVPSLALAQQGDTPTVAADETIVIQGQFVPDEKRETSEISSIIDDEFLAQTQESDIAETLKRVTGLSIDEGFVIVRGLNERYTKATLNGAPLPGNDPLRNVVPLDIFPTSVLEGVLVQKTFSPQYSGEFGGGLIELRTIGVPDEGFFEISGSLGGNTATTRQDGFSYAGDGWDWTGTDDITDFRELPNGFPTTEEIDGLTPAELELAGEQILNNYSVQQIDVPVNWSTTASFGERAEIGDESAIGFVGVVTFGNDWFTIDGARRSVAATANGLELQDEFAPDAALCEGVDIECGFFETTQTINLNALGTLGFEIDNNNTIKVTSAILRQTTKESLIQSGVEGLEDEDVIQRVRIDWIERQTWLNQVTGEHYFAALPENLFGDTQVQWRAAYNESSRNVQNRKDYEYFLDPSDNVFRLRPNFIENNQTSFARLRDEAYEFGIDVAQPFIFFDRFEGDFKFGAAYEETDRDSTLRRFFFDAPGIGSIRTRDIRAQIPEITFGRINIDPNGLILVDNTSPSDAFNANDEVFSAYGLVDVQITPVLRVSAGLRYQDTELRTQSFARGQIFCDELISLSGGTATLPEQCNTGSVAFDDGDVIDATLSGEFLLPAATVTWEFRPNFQVRAGYSQTFNRPTLREISTSPFIDPDRDTEVEGNPFLTIAEVDNYDIRFEYYFGTGEFATVGVFYKEIDNPIEESFVAEANETDRTFINGESAELIGVEWEVQKSLFFQDWFGWDFLGTREFYVNANFTYVDAETTIIQTPTNILTNLTRDLQGQSPILANLRFGFDDIDRGERGALLFNYTDGRIDTVGTFGRPDLVENPPILVDIVYAREFALPGVPGQYEFSLSARNLLGDEYTLTADDIFIEEYELGRTFTVGLSARF